MTRPVPVRPSGPVEEAGDRAAVGATRVDDRTGVTESVGFFGEGPLRMFGCTYAPPERPIGGLLVCTSLHAEMEKNYRSEVLVARSLAARGVAVQRFHYRGTGHSDGDERVMRFEGLCGDASEALQHLRSGVGEGAVAILGTRFGALVAGAVAARVGEAPLILWEPELDARHYFREGFRARLLRALREDDPTRSRSDRLEDVLRRDGQVEILGYPVHVPLYESSIGRRLDEELGDGRGAVLVVQISRGVEVRQGYRLLAESLQARGVTVEMATVRGEEDWWFVPKRWQPELDRRADQELIDLTTDWTVRRLAGGTG